MKFKKIVSIGIPESNLHDKYWQIIDSLTEQRVSLPKDSNQLTTELKDADCLLVWFNGADKSVIDQAPNLKYIGALATGVGKIDVAYAKSKNIVVTNIPGYSTEGVAELTIAVLLENLRDLSRAKTESKQQRTSESGFKGREIKGKDFGIIGLGRIGTRVAELAKAFGANTYYWSKQSKDSAYTYENLDKLVRHCDYLSLNLALNSETEGLLNADYVKAIKPGAILLNMAPHELLDLDALEKRLSQGDLTYIFDHSDPDDINDEDLKRLQKYDNCVAYPVLGYITDEAQLALQEIFVNNIKDFLQGSVTNEVQ